jgi:hypothetical protein
VATLGGGCGHAGAPSPFVGDAGADAEPDAAGGSGTGGSEPGDAGADADPTLGGPCLDVGQCTDGPSCTLPSCDTSVGRCRYTPDDSTCQDGVYCNGVEVCDPQHGCVPGPPVTCSTGDPCVIGTCVEATQSCQHAPRDADGDGDPDDHCGGGDCNDDDPTVSSLLPEVCANGKDDNCNGLVDEMPCVSPQHSTCLDPLEIMTSGTYALDTTGAPFTYPTSCGLGAMPGVHQEVAAVLLPAGPLVDVEVTAKTNGVPVSVAIAGQCGDPATELACGAGFNGPEGGQIARARARGVGSTTAASAYPIYVATASGSAVSLDVQILPPAAEPTNLTCGTAAPITPSVPVDVEILDEAMNLGSACATALGQVVYSFTLAAPADVDVYGTSTDGDGDPVLSLRDAGCALPTDEIACQSSVSAHLHTQSLAAGTYTLAVSATAPTALEVTVELSAPTAPAPDQYCTGAPVLAPNVTIPVSLSTHTDTVNLGCLAGAVNAAYELDLAAASDVLLVERIASQDTGGVGLATPACTSATALLCATGASSPVRAAKHNVAAGAYRVVPESLLGEDVELTAFVRDALPPTLVPFADGCAGAVTIPPTGGFFQGNTANATANFSAGCDEGGVQGNGAPDELLTLTLSATQRVVLDMEGSGYNTLLDVRQGTPCPGMEISMGCAIGTQPSRSYLDLQLAAGTYFIVVKGFDGDSGPWFLDVRVVDP